ncbi:UDP-2,4-diacetamido-2,4,6-trideoxy-beta-L-altropyranose hydrolase [Paenibacillus graminis]|uniref:UDP-2,4-diacetamido-2,4, 6-trideoxy-beta-L-altropyranose hydrolase n=1 Tax=Paenibacillus graminis TaxID=189425 RepID=UPI00046F4266|nr:UDP-2,4-diacetamido-2,4,6-trideoxy-beta-L-altropyranose hydrolase [Paenibacillus graminis]
MKYFIRADASEKLGIGHVMRCLALSSGLIEQKHEVIFISRELNPFVSELIVTQGCSIIHIETSFPLGSALESEFIIQLINKDYRLTKEDWLIIDHYSLDYRFESHLRSLFSNILVIDDLADRVHDCNILLDSGLDKTKEIEYNRLIPKSAIKLLGPSYALLRREFSDVSQTINNNNGEHIQNVLVCFGGTDPTNETLKTLRALEPCLNDIRNVKVILGRTNPHIKELTNLYEKNSKLQFLIQPSSVALEMASCDLAICAGGSMTWERYCLGLPGIVIAVADNQLKNAQQGHLMDIDKYLDFHQFVTKEDIRQTFESIIHSKSWLQTARQKARMIVDGKGVSRVVDLLSMRQNFLVLRDVGQNEILWMWECRNDAESRSNSVHTDEIPYSEHVKWVEQSKSMLNRKLMIAWDGEFKIAVVRLDKDGDSAIVSLNVAKEHRNKGNALKILRELETTVIKWDRRIHTLQALIRSENTASIRVFLKAGYKQCSNDNQFIKMQKKLFEEEG